MRYFFHAGDGQPVTDIDGEEHADDRAAANAAVEILSEMLPERRDALWETLRFSVAVKDEAGRLVALLTTTALLDPERDATASPTM